MTLRSFVIRGLALATAMLLLVTGMAAPSLAVDDLLVPPSLVSFHRTSPDVVRHGDDITIDWEVQDSPAKNVIFYLRDRLGSDLQVRWDAPNGTSAYSGTARFTVDETSLAPGI
ncbi:hypothetical protein [Arthrobacter sp. OAP107]|uniref:hypothetical protein n=1 Tax=Arthrobacter sp. OAP107 TaxID=3156445 RepID=UPI0033934C8A